ncbi:stalk domain-containing protein [Cohnella sp. REN36]|uniref:stalk domain-containing protein n=1 Tax=Cohnella sp. REN36 TaxID=2887347 RepID=UPI001D155B3D|nr:stalk domain-containing protein [Cohnella sp. REN36]MCC3374132.1 copper amine oxidase N-terminal domain-containing protein [Cohnella sp. REN36]
MKKKWVSIVLSAAALVGLSSNAYAAAGTTAADPVKDIAKMYRVKHELKFDLNGQSAVLDGKAVQAEKPILKDGRVFVPLRTLRQTGAAASVTWKPAQREVRIVMNPQVMPSWSDLTFKIGSDKIYTPEGTALADETIPKPFILDGITYVPVSALNWLGMSVATQDGIVSWNWSDKIIEILEPSWATDDAQATFTMLYQQDMYEPQFMYPFGAGSWGGGTGKVAAKGISQDGRLYNRVEFTANLRPGPNPMQIYAVSAGTANFTVQRRIANPQTVPVTLTEEGQTYLSLSQPASGYAKVKAGDDIPLAGSIRKPNASFDKVTIVAQRYSPGGTGLAPTVYVKDSQKELTIKDDKFAGSLSLSKPGTYLIAVNSPKYIPSTEMGLLSTQWAEFVVEVE